MEIIDIFQTLAPYLATAGLTTGALILFVKTAGQKWIENQFNEGLINLRAKHDAALLHLKSEQERVMHSLKSEQEHAVRFVQSTIDREIHRAKKLYDLEFTAMSECWPLLRKAYDSSAATIASNVASLDRLSDVELRQYLNVIDGMGEMDREAIMSARAGLDRQVEYWRWTQLRRHRMVEKEYDDFHLYLESHSIFFPNGYPEKLREIDLMILSSNQAFYHRAMDNRSLQGVDSFKPTRELREKGKLMMEELESLFRKRVWETAM